MNNNHFHLRPTAVLITAAFVCFLLMVYQMYTMADHQPTKTEFAYANLSALWIVGFVSLAIAGRHYRTIKGAISNRNSMVVICIFSALSGALMNPVSGLYLIVFGAASALALIFSVTNENEGEFPSSGQLVILFIASTALFSCSQSSSEEVIDVTEYEIRILTSDGRELIDTLQLENASQMIEMCHHIQARYYGSSVMSKEVGAEQLSYEIHPK